MSDLKKVKAQLENDISRYRTRAEVTMENAKLVEDKVRTAEDTLFKFQGMLEGVTVMKNNILKRLEAVQKDPQMGSLEEINVMLNISAQLENAARQQLHRQEGTVMTIRGVAQALKEEAANMERNARAKEDQLRKAVPADISPMEDPQQEPPKAAAKKVTKKVAKKVTKKVTKKKAKR